MSSAAMARCPKCSRIAGNYQISDVTNRFGFIGRGQRLTCSGCGTRLAIRGARANALWVALIAVAAVPFVALPELSNDKGRAAFFLLSIGIAMYLHHKLAPRFARLEFPALAEADRTPLDPEWTRASSETVVAEQIAPPLEAPAGPPEQWRCRSCREENPERFEVCWKCGAAWDQRPEDI
jgi:hypothetical protein